MRSHISRNTKEIGPGFAAVRTGDRDLSNLDSVLSEVISSLPQHTQEETDLMDDPMQSEICHWRCRSHLSDDKDLIPMSENVLSLPDRCSICRP